MDSSQRLKERTDFIQKHMLLADEAFCAGLQYAEHRLINKARVELKFSPTTWDNDIRRSLLSAYRQITWLHTV